MAAAAATAAGMEEAAAAATACGTCRGMLSSTSSSSSSPALVRRAQLLHRGYAAGTRRQARLLGVKQTTALLRQPSVIRRRRKTWSVFEHTGLCTPAHRGERLIAAAGTPYQGEPDTTDSPAQVVNLARDGENDGSDDEPPASKAVDRKSPLWNSNFTVFVANADASPLGPHVVKMLLEQGIRVTAAVNDREAAEQSLTVAAKGTANRYMSRSRLRFVDWPADTELSLSRKMSAVVYIDNAERNIGMAVALAEKASWANVGHFVLVSTANPFGGVRVGRRAQLQSLRQWLTKSFVTFSAVCGEPSLEAYKLKVQPHRGSQKPHLAQLASLVIEVLAHRELASDLVFTLQPDPNAADYWPSLDNFNNPDSAPSPLVDLVSNLSTMPDADRIAAEFTSVPTVLTGPEAEAVVKAVPAGWLMERIDQVATPERRAAASAAANAAADVAAKGVRIGAKLGGELLTLAKKAAAEAQAAAAERARTREAAEAAAAAAEAAAPKPVAAMASVEQARTPTEWVVEEAGSLGGPIATPAPVQAPTPVSVTAELETLKVKAPQPEVAKAPAMPVAAEQQLASAGQSMKKEEKELLETIQVKAPQPAIPQAPAPVAAEKQPEPAAQSSRSTASDLETLKVEAPQPEVPQAPQPVLAQQEEKQPAAGPATPGDVRFAAIFTKYSGVTSTNTDMASLEADLETLKVKPPQPEVPTAPPSVEEVRFAGKYTKFGSMTPAKADTNQTPLEAELETKQVKPPQPEVVKAPAAPEEEQAQLPARPGTPDDLRIAGKFTKFSAVTSANTENLAREATLETIKAMEPKPEVKAPPPQPVSQEDLFQAAKFTKYESIQTSKDVLKEEVQRAPVRADAPKPAAVPQPVAAPKPVVAPKPVAAPKPAAPAPLPVSIPSKPEKDLRVASAPKEQQVSQRAAPQPLSPAFASAAAVDNYEERVLEAARIAAENSFLSMALSFFSAGSAAAVPVIEFAKPTKPASLLPPAAKQAQLAESKSSSE